MLVIDQIAYHNRFTYKSPVIKTLFYLGILMTCLVGPIWLQLLMIVSVAGLTIYGTGFSLGRYLKWFLLPLPFLLVSVLTIILTISKDASILNGYVSLGSIHFGYTEASLQLALKLCLRSLSCLVCTYFFIFSVPFQQIILVLRKAKLPSVLIELTMLMYRFIFIFLEVTLEIHRSQELRFAYHGLRNSYHSMGRLFHLLVIQMMENYQQMTIALDIKFYQGEFPLESSD